jgi:hypothetical protein
MFKSWAFVLSAWLGALKGLPKALLTELPKLLWCLLRRFCAWLCHLWVCVKNRCLGKGTAPRTPPSRAPSVPISHPAFKRPDPLIYDQYYLMSLGLAVSWQNPDIKICEGDVPPVHTLDEWKNLVPVPSAYDLKPSTLYTVFAQIWNSSPDAVVSGMVVTFSYLSFGVQTESHFIGATVVDLGVKGSAHCPAYAKMLWTTPSVPGHYCIQVSFAWLDDSNPFNNLGQENTQVVQAASPAQFAFDLANPTRDYRTFSFEYDTYAIPTPPPCPDQPTPPGELVPAAPGAVPANVAIHHRRADFPLPPGWTIAFDPPAPVLPPAGQQSITATVTPPDSFHGTLPLNIHLFAGAQLVGGITALINRV